MEHSGNAGLFSYSSPESLSPNLGRPSMVQQPSVITLTKLPGSEQEREASPPKKKKTRGKKLFSDEKVFFLLFFFSLALLFYYLFGWLKLIGANLEHAFFFNSISSAPFATEKRRESSTTRSAAIPAASFSAASFFFKTMLRSAT